MSWSMVNVVYTIESILIMLLMTAALIFLLVKRHWLAAGGLGVLIFSRIVSIAWPFLISAADGLRRESFEIASLVYNTVYNVLFVVGLGLILAEILLKRSPRGLQSHP